MLDGMKQQKQPPSVGKTRRSLIFPNRGFAAVVFFSSLALLMSWRNTSVIEITAGPTYSERALVDQQKQVTVAPPDDPQECHRATERCNKKEDFNKYENEEDNDDKTKRGLKISYVTSYWAQESNNTQQQQQRQQQHPHRREIEAAILANINNPHFDQVVILLDGISETSNCTHFIQHMKHLQEKYFVPTQLELQQQSISVSGQDQGRLKDRSKSFSHVNCVNILGGQPTYFQIFNYSISEEYVHGDIVVLSNADHAFDDTISKAPLFLLSASAENNKINSPSLSSDNVGASIFLVLSSRGFTNKIPNTLKTLYNNLMPDKFRLANIPSREEMRSMGGDPPLSRCVDKKNKVYSSWDTYIFQPRDVRGRIREEEFKREKQNGEWRAYMMNEIGGENAALFDLTRNVPNAVWYNACREINSWHFHFAPKLHKKMNLDDPSSVWKEYDHGMVPKPKQRWTRDMPSRARDLTFSAKTVLAEEDQQQTLNSQ